MKTLASFCGRLSLRVWHAVVLAILMLGLLGGAGLFAGRTVACAEPYTYTVTVNAGREGVLDPNGIAAPAHAVITGDGQHLKVSGLQYGDRISFLGNIATPADDSAYYVRGIRYGGRDGNTSLAELSFEVTEDRDYVVAFARANDLVPYTVQYVTAEGEPLYEEQIYYGNVGDKPVVACLYFDGYQPRAYNITKTLDANPEENVLTFVYDPIVLPEPEAPQPQPAPENPSIPTPDDTAAGNATVDGGDTVQPGDAPASAGDGAADVGDVPAAEIDDAPATAVLGVTAAGESFDVPTLTTNNGGGSPAPAAPAGLSGNEGVGADGTSEGTAEGTASSEETIEDNANPLGTTQLADLDEIEDNATPLALFGSAIPMAGSHNAGLSPWLLGLICAAVVLVVILVAWLLYDRRSRRAFAQSGYAAPTDAPKTRDGNDDSETFF